MKRVSEFTKEYLEALFLNNQCNVDILAERYPYHYKIYSTRMSKTNSKGVRYKFNFTTAGLIEFINTAGPAPKELKNPVIDFPVVYEGELYTGKEKITWVEG